MKEAAGEANMTVVTIVLIAIVLGVGTLIVTNVMRNVGSKSDTTSSQTATYNETTCTNAGGIWANNKCTF